MCVCLCARRNDLSYNISFFCKVSSKALRGLLERFQKLGRCHMNGYLLLWSLPVRTCVCVCVCMGVCVCVRVCA